MKYVVIILLFFINLSSHAQFYKDKEGFTYSHLVVQHPNGRIDYDNVAIGAIIFNVKNNEQIVGISLDREIMYQGIVLKKEKGDLENGQCTVSYEFNSNYQGITVPVILTAIYGSRGSNVPFKFFLTILNRYTRRPVRYNIFTKIEKSNVY